MSDRLLPRIDAVLRHPMDDITISFVPPPPLGWKEKMWLSSIGVLLLIAIIVLIGARVRRGCKSRKPSEEIHTDTSTLETAPIKCEKMIYSAL